MDSERRRFLEGVASHTRLDPLRRARVMRELDEHLEESIQELLDLGLPPQEAVKEAVRQMGPPRVIARGIYQVYHQGSWQQALLAAGPHFLVAFSFLFHLWTNPWWVAVLLAFAAAFTLGGWLAGRQPWFYAWLGYCLIPLLALSFFLLSFLWQRLGGPESGLVLALAFIPVAWVILFVIMTWVVRRDWIYASFMVLPLPLVGGLAVALGRDGSGALSEPVLSWNFLFLALAAAAFVRLKQRLLKLFALAAALVVVLTMALPAEALGLSALGLVTVALLLVGFILSPALLERRISGGRGRW